MKVIGLRGDTGFDGLAEHFVSRGIEAAIMDPMRVFGAVHAESALMHARRSFDNGTNRSKTVLTEFLLYMAGERQISKAMAAMSPKDGQNEFVIAFLDDVDDAVLEGLPMTRCDDIVKGTEEKARSIGLRRDGMDIPYEDMALEMVAMVDILKS